MRLGLAFLSLVLGLILPILPAFGPQGPTVAQAAEDWDIPGGHFFTQTRGNAPSGGYAVRDDVVAPFWSEFRRLGGVQ
ncbi:MAG: hypothetical protein C4315_06765, partial [Chloroflexota bacterium]